MFKRLLSIILSLCLVVSFTIVVADYTSFETQAATTIDYGLVDNVQYGQILHCWNWSFDNIRKNMPLIASQGFTAIQTSPIQSSKESTRESWSSVNNSAWVYYQPISFNIEQNSWNALGTKTQFEAMCAEAHKYGVKVIVDTVFNHMANDSTENTINPQIPSDLRNDPDCWYSVTWNTSNWEDRYDVTHNCLSGFPDLNTSNSKVQSYAIGFLKECIDAGADGFRFDAVKHIETPADAYGTASDFWPNVLGAATDHAKQTRGITPYYYGELLGSPGGGLSVTAYTDHMSVTDNNTGNTVRNAIANGNAAGACVPFTSNGAASDKAVQWNESHDTYYADNDSIWISNDNMKKTWAIVGSRAQICGLYLARPENNQTTMLGDGDITAWADKEVKAINRFKNYFAGHSEYMSYSGNIVYNERGNTGVVLVNAKGGSTSVSVPAHRMYDGVYTDAITGNHFSVSNGTISGTIGDSGIAVVYSYPSKVSVDKDSQAFRGDTLDVTLNYNEATSGTYSIDGKDAVSFTNGDVVSVGCGVNYGEEVSLLATATGGTTTDSTIKYYKKLHPDTELTIYFDNSSKNWSSVYAYIYNSDGNKIASWPGTEMSYDDDLGLYYIDVPSGFETSKVVFNDGNGNQTPSSGGHAFNAYTSIYKDGYFYGYNTGVSGNLYFKPSSNWLSDNARFAVYVWNGSSNSWVDFKDSDADGIFEANLPDGTWNECIFARMNPSSKNNNWDNVWNQTGDMGISNNCNYFMIDNGWDTSSGTWSIIDTSVVDSATDAFLTGSFNNWNKTSNPFIYTDYNKAVASIDLPSGSYTFKMFKGGEWFGNPGTINDTTDGVGWRMCRNDDDNCTLIASGGAYTFTLDTETLKITVDYEAKEVETLETVAPTEDETQLPTDETIEPTLEPTEPPVLKQKGYYLVGIINGVDRWGLEDLTDDRLFSSNPNNSGEYMLDYSLLEGDEVKVVYFDGIDITKWYGSGDNYKIGSSKAGDCTVYFRPEGNSSWSYEYFTVISKSDTTDPTDPSISEGYYLVGTINGEDCWELDTLIEERMLKPNPNNSGEYMLDYTFTVGDEVKVVHFDGNDITRWYNSSGDNYAIGSSKAGDCTVYFRPDGNYSWSYYYFTIIPKTVDETQKPTDAPTEKPTEEQSEAPSVTPTDEPSQEPTIPPISKPTKVENIVASPDTTSVRLSWDPVDIAVKYWIYKYNSSNYKWECVTSATTTSTVVNSLKPNTEYQFKVIFNDADYVVSSLSEADTITVNTEATVNIESISGTAGLVDATISWDGVTGAVKYWIYKAWSEEGPFYCYGSTVNTSYKVRGLQAGSDYYFKVIVVTQKNGKTILSNLSEAPVVKVETGASENITTILENVTSTTATISWPAFENAEKYWVMYSNTTKDVNKKDQWKTYTSTTDTTYTFKNLKKNTTYYFTVCAKYPDPQFGDVVAYYIAVDTKTLYSDENFLSFTPSGTKGVTVSWPEEVNSAKSWVYVYDEDGNLVIQNGTTTNYVTFNSLKNYKNYTFALLTLDADKTARLITPPLGLPYTE